MGNTHQRSNLVGYAGSETITGFDKVQGDEVTCGTVNATRLNVGRFIKTGTSQGIFWGNINIGGSVCTLIRTYIATPLNIKGSLYMSTKGKVFKVLTSKTATTC